MSQNCPHQTSCEMFELFRVGGALGTWKAMYCEQDFKRCARFKLSASGKNVPINLLPTGKLLKKR